MVRDRLLEMRELSGLEEGGNLQKSESKRSVDLSMDQFLVTVDETRHILMMLSREREAIRLQQEDCLASGCGDTAKCRLLNNHVDQFIEQSRGVRRRLKDAIINLEKYPQRGYGSARARQEQIRALVVSFDAIMTKFSEDQSQYKARAAEKIVAYCKKQNIELSGECIDDAIENGSLFELTRNINLGVAQKRALFDDVKNRATDIMIIEKQIREVEELFLDMQMLVQSQGETIDRIETSVMNATDFAGRAEQNVQQAVELRRKSRKWKVVICIALIFLVLAFLIVLKMFSPV